MSYRKPALKAQAKILRAVFAERQLPQLSASESLELVARLNGYPSWNVASQAVHSDPAKGGKDAEPGSSTKLRVRIWTALHVHRHGEDIFTFTHEPSESDVIAAIEASSTWEPHLGETIEFCGGEDIEIDVPWEMTKAAARAMPSPLIGVYEIRMLDLLEYDVPDTVPEWAWVQSLASFAHRGNGVEGGVWEFMVHRDRLARGLVDAPKALKPELQKALELGAAWVLFHQG